MDLKRVEELMDQGVFSIVNRSRMYMAPSLIYYGDTFSKEFRKFSCFGVFTADEDKQPGNYPELYCLFNIQRSILTNFMESICFFRKHHSYVTDYLVGDLIYGKLHMIVIRIPEKHYESYFYFLDSKYSKMYTRKQVDLYLPSCSNSKIMGARATLLKDPEVVANISEEFNVKPEYVQELDEKLIPDQEIFNHKDMSLEKLKNLKLYDQKNSKVD